MRVCLDERTHGVDTLAYDKLAGFQGPSLLVFNDSVFRESDFESISRIGDSVKREQVGKTGRFGVGFNSVYHLTDMPSFVSGRHVVFFDPHCAFLPNVNAANPGKRIDFVANDVLGANPDQFAPFAAFGCDVRNEFRGTTFRFPLRTPAQAASSKLSKTSYVPDGVRRLLRAFAREKTLDMLFLKTSKLPRCSSGRPGNVPRLISRTSVRDLTPALRAARGAFTRASAAMAAGTPAELTANEVTFETEGETRTTRRALGTTPRARTFFVSQALGENLAPLVTANREKYGMKLVPWAAVAAELAPKNASDGDAEKTSRERRDDDGRAFCFLPLPARTGLPVHVNAYFELSSNRRDIWFGEDMAGGGAARSEWNRALLGLAAARVRSFVIAQRRVWDPRDFYALLPASPPAPWGAWWRERAPSSATRPCFTPPRTAGDGSPRGGDVPIAVTSDRRWRGARRRGRLHSGRAGGGARTMEEHAVSRPRGSVRAAFDARSAGGPASTERRAVAAMTLLRYCLSASSIRRRERRRVGRRALVPLADGTCGVFDGVVSTRRRCTRRRRRRRRCCPQGRRGGSRRGRDDVVAIGRVGDDAR